MSVLLVFLNTYLIHKTLLYLSWPVEWVDTYVWIGWSLASEWNSINLNIMVGDSLSLS